MHPHLSGDLYFCTCMFFGIGMDYSFLLLQKRSEEKEQRSDGCSEVQTVNLHPREFRKM